MIEASAPPLDRAHQMGRTAGVVAVVVATMVAVTALVDLAGSTAGDWRTAVVTPDWQGVQTLASTLLLNALLVAPSLMLAGAVWELSRVLDAFGRGDFFTLGASAAVRRAGQDALWALAFKIVASPTLYSWITGEGRGVIWNYEPFDLGLLAFAAFVMVLGRVLEAAVQIKQENDQIV